VYNGFRLFTYVPASPRTVLLIVKSKYYDTPNEYFNTLYRFGKKYGNGNPDPFLSSIFRKKIIYYLIAIQ